MSALLLSPLAAAALFSPPPVGSGRSPLAAVALFSPPPVGSGREVDRRSLIASHVVLSAALAISGTPLSAIAADGEAIFEAKCAACHMGGGNIVAGSKTLRTEALDKNGYADVPQIVELCVTASGTFHHHPSHSATLHHPMLPHSIRLRTSASHS